MIHETRFVKYQLHTRSDSGRLVKIIVRDSECLGVDFTFTASVYMCV